MVFKNFRFHVIARVALLTASIILFAWCLTEGLYLRSIYLAAAALILLVELIWYIDRFNRDVKTFMVSLLQRDFTTHYQSTGRGKTFDELYEVLNQISSAFRKLGTEKEIQHRYLEMLVDHVRVSILSIDADGKIQLANQAVKQLLRKDVLTSLKSLESFDERLAQAIREIRTGETRLVKIKLHSDLLQLSIHASEFKLEEQYYKLISMQDIRSELDAREMEAWQKLIRVLSHEIMNSVAPIISLSGTLHGMVAAKKELAPATDETYAALDQGLEAIKIRSEGLYNFTQSYRKLTGIPALSLKETNIRELIMRVKMLLQQRLDETGITFHVTGENVFATVDPELMEHVIINLLLNAIEALSGRPEPSIHIRMTQSSSGNVAIHVLDNGEGMDDATAERIFVPFFTTRRSGSGIGLALTKQILQLHRADIRFSSEKGRGTEFVITL
jgi:nitrogen fixation/metabolism regulation signal transduction histidine kinase